MTRGFAQRFETLGRMVDQISEVVSFGLPFEEISAYALAIDRVSLEEARAAALKYIDVSKVVIIIVGDVKAIETGIRELNLGPIVQVDCEGKPIFQDC